jgi:formylglycine-generating enzyme required for sulfatase activity
VLLRIEVFPVLWTTRVRANPFAMDTESVNSSRLLTVTEAEGCQAPSFWQEEKKARINRQTKTDVVFNISPPALLSTQ